jgi:predicted deacylase
MNVFDEVKWKEHSVSSSAVYGVCSLKIGEVGEGSPRATLLAGVHGDEGPWGSLAIRYLLEDIENSNLLGSMNIVPVANPLAMEADSRVSPIDNLDLNRVFPGDPKGSHTQRIAAILVEQALNGSDFVYDLHGGGSWCVNAFGFSFEGSEDIVSSISPPFIMDANQKQGTLTGYSMIMGAKVTAIEMGGRGRNEKKWARKIANGLKKSLGDVGVIHLDKAKYHKQTPPKKVGPSSVLRPDMGGIFIPIIQEEVVGTVINRGTPMGKVVDPVTMNCIQEFTAPFDATAVLLLRPRISVVDGGAMLYVVAPIKEEVD